ncbi:MAG: hypothetical protein ACRDPM_25235 [Solirubrobacteraceae bacterium]
MPRCTGGEWTPAELRELYKLGGFAAVTPDVAPTLAQKIVTMAQYDKPANGFVGIGLGTDTNGFSSLPGPRPDAKSHPLRYPFTSYDASVTFTRERTGTRTYDLNRDGVAQYGLVADLIGDVERTRAGRRALPLLFNSRRTWIRGSVRLTTAERARRSYPRGSSLSISPDDGQMF